MKKNKSIIGAVFVATILCVSVLASSVFATDSFEFTGGTVTKYTGTKTNVTIPSTDGSTTITTISATAFDGCDDVTVVYLPKTITTVENGAFSGCSADVKVIFDMDSPTASVPAGMENWGVNNVGGTITYYMGSGNTTMTLSDVGKISSTTKYAYIKDGIVIDLISEFFEFPYTCGRKLTYTNAGTVPSTAHDVSRDQDKTVMMWEDGEDVYIWFDGDELVMPTDMSLYYTETGLSYHFEDSFVEIININLINTSKTTDMSYCFMGVYIDNNQGTLDLATLDTSSVTNMEGMFYGCYTLKTLDISNFDTSNVTNMKGMFVGCELLETIDVTSFDMSSVTDTDEMFARCDELTTVYARTQADADIIKASTNFPSGATVIVK